MTEAETNSSGGDIACVGLSMTPGSHLPVSSLHHASGTDPDTMPVDMQVGNAFERTASLNPYKSEPVQACEAATRRTPMMINPIQVNGIRTDGEMDGGRERNLGDDRDELS